MCQSAARRLAKVGSSTAGVLDDALGQRRPVMVTMLAPLNAYGAVDWRLQRLNAISIPGEQAIAEEACEVCLLSGPAYAKVLYADILPGEEEAPFEGRSDHG